MKFSLSNTNVLYACSEILVYPKVASVKLMKTRLMEGRDDNNNNKN